MIMSASGDGGGGSSGRGAVNNKSVNLQDPGSVSPYLVAKCQRVYLLFGFA